MVTGNDLSIQPPPEVDENHFFHPKSSDSISYSQVLQNKYTAAATKNSQPFKPFSVDCAISQKGNTQSQSTLVFGDFESKSSCTLKPIMEYCGKKGIFFQKSDKLRLINKINHVLIGKFSHGRPFMSDIRKFFINLNLKGSYNISIFDSKHMYIECVLFEDFIKIWLQKIWMVKGFQMRVFKWSVDFKPQHESPVVPVWIRLYGLPIYLFEKEALMSIANAIGNPLYICRNNLNRSNLSYASLCVELDVTKPLLDEVWIDFGKEKWDTNGQTEEKRDGFWQKLSYGLIPSYCVFCLHVGHSSESCKQRIEKGPGEHIGVCGKELDQQHSGMQVIGVQFSGAQGSDVQISASQSVYLQNSGSGVLPRGAGEPAAGEPAAKEYVGADSVLQVSQYLQQVEVIKMGVESSQLDHDAADSGGARSKDEGGTIKETEGNIKDTAGTDQLVSQPAGVSAVEYAAAHSSRVMVLDGTDAAAKLAFARGCGAGTSASKHQRAAAVPDIETNRMESKEFGQQGTNIEADYELQVCHFLQQDEGIQEVGTDVGVEATKGKTDDAGQISNHQGELAEHSLSEGESITESAGAGNPAVSVSKELQQGNPHECLWPSKQQVEELTERMNRLRGKEPERSSSLKIIAARSISPVGRSSEKMTKLRKRIENLKYEQGRAIVLEEETYKALEEYQQQLVSYHREKRQASSPKDSTPIADASHVIEQDRTTRKGRNRNKEK